MCLLLAAPTSTHGVFTSLNLSQYCCLHLWKNKFGYGPCCVRIFKGQRSSTNHKMLLFVSWRNKYAIIEWPLFDAPTSIHGVFTSFSISQCCCLHFWKNKVGSMLAQRFLRVKSQAKITKCYFWVVVVLRSPIHANEPSEYNGMLYRSSNRVLNNGIKVIILICMDGTSQYQHYLFLWAGAINL